MLNGDLNLNGNASLSNSEDSDDSIVGEHSPFVKHITGKRYSIDPNMSEHVWDPPLHVQI